MSQNVGTWIVGDTIKELHYEITDFVAQLGTVAGWTVKLQGVRPGDAALSIDLAAYSFIVDPGDADNAIAKFKAIPGSLSVSGKTDTFECRLEFTKSADKGFTEPFALSVRSWP